MKWWLLLGILLVSHPVLAQETIGPRATLPTVETVVVKDGVLQTPLPDGEYKILNIPQWRQTLQLSSAYLGLYNWRLTTEGTLKTYDGTVRAYDTAIVNYKAQILTLKDDREYLQLRLGQELNANKQRRQSFKIEKGIMWGVIVVETILIGIFGVKSLAQTSSLAADTDSGYTSVGPLAELLV